MRRITLTVLVAVLVLLAGCSGASGGDGTTTAAPTTMGQPTTDGAVPLPADVTALRVVDATPTAYVVDVEGVSGPLDGLRVTYADGSARTFDGSTLPADALVDAVGVAAVGDVPMSMRMAGGPGTTGGAFGGIGAHTTVVYAVTVAGADGPVLVGWDAVTCGAGTAVTGVDVGVEGERFVTRGVDCGVAGA